MYITSIGHALPAHYYDQDTLLDAFRGRWQGRFYNPERIDQIFRNVLVGGRHLALPIDRYAELHSFAARNDAFIEAATELAARAIETALSRGGVSPSEVDRLIFVSSTGIATPSIDARLINRLGLSPTVRRTPVFGWGCLGGTAGVARLTDQLRADPGQLGVLVCVELCSLAVQLEDASIANLISSGLFGDGAAAVVIGGAARAANGPAVIASGSSFYPDSEQVMGWRITDRGFQVVLSADVPDIVTRFVRNDVERFLAQHNSDLSRIRRFVCHPGGPKVLEAFERAFELPRAALSLSWESLQQIGNVSSASVLMILEQTLRAAGEPGSHDLMIAMGPGFCSELVLLQW